MSVVCQTCGRLSPPGAQWCQYCGANLPSTPVYQDPFRSRPQRPVEANRWGDPAYSQPIRGLKDPNTGLLIELLPGLVGFLGVGHIWSGQTALGIGLMIGYWLSGLFFAILTAITLGLICFFPVYLLLWPGAPIISAIMLQRRLQRQQQQLVRASTSPYPY